MSSGGVVFSDLKIKLSPAPDQNPHLANCTIEDSPDGNSTHTRPVDLTLDRLRLANLRVCRLTGNALRQFGQDLFSRLFPLDNSGGGNPGQIYVQSIQTCQQSSRGLRLRLVLPPTGSIAEVPWEYLYEQGVQSGVPDRFPLLIRGNSLLRSSVRGAPKTESIFYPVRILFIGASPQHPDYPELNLQRELEQMERAVPTAYAQRFYIEPLIPATLRALETRLNNPDISTLPHWLHFACHGGINPAGYKTLVLEEPAAPGKHGGPAYLTADTLWNYLAKKSNIRVIVLNSCASALGAHSSSIPETYADPRVAAVAQALVERGMPLVIAMQADLPDDVAAYFTGRFYEHIFFSLAQSPASQQGMFENALCAARTAIVADHSHDHPAWGIPVVYCGGVPETFLEFRVEPQDRVHRQCVDNLKAKRHWYLSEQQRLDEQFPEEAWAQVEWSDLQRKIETVSAEIERLVQQS